MEGIEFNSTFPVTAINVSKGISESVEKTSESNSIVKRPISSLI